MIIMVKKTEGLENALQMALHLIIIFLLISMNFSFVVSQGAGAEDKKEVKSESFSCSTSAISPEEIEKFKDEVFVKGFDGNAISSGTPANSDRDALDSNKIVLTSEDTNTAVKAEIPSEKISPFEVQHLLGDYGKGAFAIGLVLDDSLRTGRCKNLGTCPLTGSNLKLRNSGTGFIEETKSILADFIDGNKYRIEALTEEDRKLIDAQLYLDENKFDAKTIKRIESVIIPNSILADSFTAKMETNCRNSGCFINSYSLFDKYFNAWFSLDMVVSSFAPTLFSNARKMMGWSARRGWPWHLNELDFYKKFKNAFYSTDTVAGKANLVKMDTDIQRYGLGVVFEDLVDSSKGYRLIRSGPFADWLFSSLESGSLSKLKTPQQRAAMVRVIKRINNYSQPINYRNKELQGVMEKAIKQFGPDSQQAIQARLSLAQYLAKTGWEMDDKLHLDLPEFWMRYGSTNLYPYSFMNSLTGETHSITSQARYVRQNVLRPFFEPELDDFYKVGNRWKPRAQCPLCIMETDGAGNLKLYAPQPGDYIGRVKPDELPNLMSTNIIDLTVKLPATGQYIMVNSANLKQIKEFGAAEVEVYRVGKMVDTGKVLTPEFLAGTMTDNYFPSRVSKVYGNSTIMLNTLLEQGWETRRYASLLDKIMAEESELIKAYFSFPKGAAKWTALPYVYWAGKRGFGSENFSAYQLPTSWRSIEFQPAEGEIYDDAFIDFFANEGSDQGDLFIRVINNLPWKMVLNAAVENFAPLKNMYDKLTKGELRNEVENLALYMSAPEECEDCTFTLKSTNLRDFSPFFFSNRELKSYLLEDIESDKAKKLGQTLISFAHHTNLEGANESGGNKAGLIDLLAARKDGKTCAQKIADLHIAGLPIGRAIPKRFQGAEVGAILAISESIGYFTFMWSGILGSVVQQVVITPQLHECVDDEQGYYTHYFAPAKSETEEKKNATELSTQNVSNMIKENADKFLSSFQGDENSLTRDAIEKIGKSIDKLAGSSTDSDIIQATLTTFGQSSGQLRGKQLFYFWCQPGCELHKSEYPTEGRMVVSDENGGSAEFDYANGILSINGRPVITNPDSVRLSYTDTRIPAIVIPNAITHIALPDSDALVFEITAKGEAFVRDKQVLECIKSGVKEQSGLELNSDELSEAFGNVEMVVTDSHPGVKPLQDRIVAEGTPRKIAEGADARISIFANKEVVLSKSNDNEPEIGKLKSIQLKNGSIVYNPEKDELLVLLRHHENAILQQNDVANLNAKLTDTTNPITDCTEPAIDLSVAVNGAADSAVQGSKEEQFNKALQHYGPYQVFETDTKRFVIYSKLDGGECKDYFKVIDKETGKVLEDSAIKEIVQTPDGKIKIVTEDGKTHELEFSSDNGRPILTYNGTPENLRYAQGRNGAFWYDPEKGLWYAENGQLLPLLEAFRQQGISTQARPDGSVSSTPGGNFMNVNLGEQQGLGFNLPSLPENALYLLMFISTLVALFAIIRMRRAVAVRP